VAEEARRLERTEEPRRPAQEAHRTVAGRREPALPAPAPPAQAHASPPPPPAAPPARPGAPAAPASAASLRAAAPTGLDGGGVEGAVLQHAAHLRIEPNQQGVGEIELHLRVRGGVAHLRVDGEGSQVGAARAPELATALASAGLSLGQIDAPAGRPPVPAAPAPGGAESHARGDGRTAGFDAPAQGQSEPRDRGEPGTPAHPNSPSARRGRSPSGSGRVHVEA
jgi:hypothetical protein